MKPQPWKTLQSRQIYHNPWMSLREDIAEMPDRRTTIYGVVTFGECVGVVPFVDADHVMLVRQYRYVQEENHRWEIPTGGVNEGETLEQAAQSVIAAEDAKQADIVAGQKVELDQMQERLDRLLDGNRDNNEHINGNFSGGVFIQSCNRWRFRNVTSRNYNGDGFSFQVCDDIQFENCNAVNNADLGFHPGRSQRLHLDARGLLDLRRAKANAGARREGLRARIACGAG